MSHSRKASAAAQAVLGVLLEAAPAWRHGYDLMGRAGVSSGTLYPLLIRLTERGYLDAEWRTSESPGRPPRHAYRLTSAGRAYAVEQLQAVRADQPLTGLPQTGATEP